MEIQNFFAQSDSGMDYLLGFLVIFGLILILIYLASGIKIIKEWERAPVLRLGRYTGLKGPGIFWIIPGIDKNFLDPVFPVGHHKVVSIAG